MTRFGYKGRYNWHILDSTYVLSSRFGSLDYFFMRQLTTRKPTKTNESFEKEMYKIFAVAIDAQL